MYRFSLMFSCFLVSLTVTLTPANATLSNLTLRSTELSSNHQLFANQISLISNNGRVRLTFPNSWETIQREYTPPEFILIASDTNKGLDLVLTERSKAAGESLDRVAQTVLEQGNATLENAQVTPTNLKQIQNYQAAQYIVTSTVRNEQDVTILVTVIEGKAGFYVITLGGETESIKHNQAEIEQIIKSFEEIQAVG